MYIGAFNILYFIIVMPAVIFALIAQASVSSTFKKYSRVATKNGMTGYDAARMVLDSHGLGYVRIERVSGNLTDHFDPKTNVIRLSDSVYSTASAAAVGVAAHEAGHAVQYAEEYAPMKIRAAIIPVCNLGSQLSMPLVLLGIIFSFPPIAYAGVVAFAVATLFQLVTLPVEFNASRRAMACLEGSYRFDSEELRASRRVLTAAAMTYVAALATSLANLLYLAAIAGGSRRK